jgi:hypothetical protein
MHAAAIDDTNGDCDPSANSADRTQVESIKVDAE